MPVSAVCLFVMNVILQKTDKQMEMQFSVWRRGDSGNHVLRGGARILSRKGHFEVVA